MVIEKEYKGALKIKDYLKYLLYNNLTIVLSPLFIIILVIAIIISIIKTGFTFSLIIYSLPILLFIFTYIKIFIVLKKVSEYDENISSIKLRVTDNELVEINNGEKYSLEFSKAYCYGETKNYFYIYATKNDALILKKDKYNSDEIVKLQNTFSSKLRKRKLLTINSILIIIVLLVLSYLIFKQI